MKKLVFIVFLGLVGSVYGVELGVQYPNAIAAVVEKKIITMEDVHRKAGPFLAQLQREVRSQAEFEARFNALSMEILENMVDQELLVHEFKEVKKGKIPESYLNNHYNKFIEENFEGDRSKYMEFLKHQGMTQKEFEASQESEIIVSFLRGELKQSLAEVSPKKIERYFEEHKGDFEVKEAVELSQIMMGPIEGDENGDKLVAKAGDLVKKLRAGGDFAAMAKEYSEDHVASKGGYWGWVEEGEIRDELSKVAFGLNSGEVAEPVMVDGYAFVLKVGDRRKAGYQLLKDVRGQIEEILANEEAERVQKAMIEKLRKKAHIQYYVGQDG